MLSSISWQHYIAAILLLTVTYYTYVMLRYYQKEIASLFNRGQSTTAAFSSIQSVPSSVIGKAKPDNGTYFGEAQELQFAEPLPDEVETTATDPLQELFAEASGLMEAFRESGTKHDFISLFGILLEPYKKYVSETGLSVILMRITEVAKTKLPFPLTQADLQGMAV